MNRYLHNAFARLLVAAGVAITLVSGSAEAYVLMGTSPGGHLTMNLAMQALIGNQPASDAMAQWNQVGIGPGQDHAFFVAQTSGTSGSCGLNHANEVTWSDTDCGLAFGSSTLAVTTTWSSAGKVVEVDMLFNNTRSWSSYSGPLRYNANGTSLNDLNRVALHELGHAAGLDHPDGAGQTVSAIMNSHISNTYTLQADDIAGAHAIAWQTIASASAPVCSLTASPTSITAGGSTTLMASCSPAATSYSWTNTGFSSTSSAGLVSPSVSTTYWVTGYNAIGPGNSASVNVSVTGVAANYADLWWAGNAENGWGLSIHQHGNAMFNVLYVYDSAGKPVWYVMPTGTWDSAFSTYAGMVYQPTSAPLSAYTPTGFVPGAAVGNVTITFTGTSSAVLRYTINGISGQKTIQRQIFGYGVAPLNVGDMWWGGASQDGWGISITQQSAILFGAWFSYGPDGRVTWYVLPNGTWNGTTYSGPFYSTTASAWLGAPYDASQLTVREVGSMSLSFTGSGSAIMTYAFTSGPFAGITQSKQIMRQAF